MPNLICIPGPTASGKTALAVMLAQELNGEVVSCDSMQIYKGMEIGTAAPTKAEMANIPHHLIGICSPDESFSAAQWVQLAQECIHDISVRGKLPVFCGGTGLYLDSLTKIAHYKDDDRDDSIRDELLQIAVSRGNDVLHNMLAEIDPDAAEAIHPNNVKRVVRAIEIFRTTGKTKTEIDKLQTSEAVRYQEFRVILTFQNRDVLYDRINRRVGMMMDSGLLEEARKLYLTGDKNGTAQQAIGYKEFYPYFDGFCTLEEAVEQIRQSSRQYAKRQITWFRRSDGYRLLMDNADGTLRTPDSLLEEIEKAASETGFVL